MAYDSNYAQGILLAIMFSTFLVSIAGTGNVVERNKPIRCFSKITVTNGLDSVKLEYCSCQEAIAAVGQYLYINSAGSMNSCDSCLGGQQLFYCATVAEVTDSLAPLVDIGDGLKRYAIETVFCSYMSE